MSRAIRRAVSTLVWAAAVGLPLWFIGVLSVSWPVALLVTALCVAIIRLLVWSHVEQVAEAATWHAPPPQGESAGPLALDYRLVRLRRDLRDALERDDRNDAIQPLVRDLAFARLRTRHGIDASSDRPAARARFPDEVWTYLTLTPRGTQRSDPQLLARVLDHVERL